MPFSLLSSVLHEWERWCCLLGRPRFPFWKWKHQNITTYNIYGVIAHALRQWWRHRTSTTLTSSRLGFHYTLLLLLYCFVLVHFCFLPMLCLFIGVFIFPFNFPLTNLYYYYYYYDRRARFFATHPHFHIIIILLLFYVAMHYHSRSLTTGFWLHIVSHSFYS